MRRRVAALAAASAAYTPVPALELSTHAPLQAPAITSTLTQPAGQNATRTISAVFPHAFTYNPRFRVPGCQPADEQAETCPEASRLGTIDVTTRYGSGSGPVHLMRDLRLVAFVSALGGLYKQRMVGTVSVHDDGAAEIVFDNLPDISATYGRIALEGGDKGVLLNPRECGTYQVHAKLTSQQDEVVEQDLPIAIEGCRGEVRVRRARFAGRVLRWAVSEPAATRVLLMRRGPREWRQVRAWRTRGTTLKLRSALGAGRWQFWLRAVTADGRASFAQVVRVRVPSRAP
jgi:hypothetical protein